MIKINALLTTRAEGSTTTTSQPRTLQQGTTRDGFQLCSSRNQSWVLDKLAEAEAEAKLEFMNSTTLKVWALQIPETLFRHSLVKFPSSRIDFDLNPVLD